MNDADLWLLPEGVEEILPPSARRLEHLRRKLLDLFDQWGYELVIPPLIEFLEPLLIGAGNDLNLQTFKLTDQLSGRMMGVPADMTPQVARIDAHHLRGNGLTRLCYTGPVLRTRSDGLGGSRNPFQIGAELYGHRGYESDSEVLCLMLETLKAAEVADIHLDLGHVAIFRSLVQQAGLDSRQENLLFAALQHKALPEIHEHLRTMGLPSGLRDTFLALAELNGGEETLPLAERLLGATDEGISQALETLHQIAAGIQHRWPGVPINFDLAELRGYRYHTGLVFAAYIPGQGQALAKGGRYDNIARAFGRTRPATGFSTDLRNLLALAPPTDISAGAIYAPRADDPTLEAMINELRGRGERVIRALPGSDPGPEALDCNRMLTMEGETWVVVPSESYTEDRR